MSRPFETSQQKECDLWLLTVRLSFLRSANQDTPRVEFAKDVPVGVWSAESWELLFAIEDVPHEIQSILDEWIPKQPAGKGGKDFRNWEWHYLDRKLDTSVATLRSELRYFWDVDLSRDGQRVLTVENEDTNDTAAGRIVLWETRFFARAVAK